MIKHPEGCWYQRDTVGCCSCGKPILVACVISNLQLGDRMLCGSCLATQQLDAYDDERWHWRPISTEAELDRGTLADLVGEAIGLRHVDFAAGETVSLRHPDHALIKAMIRTIQERDVALAKLKRHRESVLASCAVSAEKIKALKADLMQQISHPKVVYLEAATSDSVGIGSKVKFIPDPNDVLKRKILAVPADDHDYEGVVVSCPSKNDPFVGVIPSKV
jgi:hypothetical protein